MEQNFLQRAQTHCEIPLPHHHSSLSYSMLWIAAIPNSSPFHMAFSPEDPLGMDTGPYTGPLVLGCCRCGCALGCDALDWLCKQHIIHF